MLNRDWISLCLANKALIPLTADYLGGVVLILRKTRTEQRMAIIHNTSSVERDSVRYPSRSSWYQRTKITSLKYGGSKP